MPRVIIHSFYTDGMHPLAKTFLESLAYFNPTTDVVIDAMGISDGQQRELYSLHKCVSITKHFYPIKEWSILCRVGVKKIIAWKKQIENGFITPDTRFWKLLTAGDYRVKCLQNLLSVCSTETKDIIVLHFDIDTLFRSNILPITEALAGGFDAALKLRPNIEPVKARITIDAMVLKANKAVLKWVSDWVRYIDAVPIRKRPVGFGQISCWQAYCGAVGARFATLPIQYGLPGRNAATDAIWCGNVHKLRKEHCAVIFKKELEKIKRKNKEG